MAQKKTTVCFIGMRPLNNCPSYNNEDDRQDIVEPRPEQAESEFFQ